MFWDFDINTMELTSTAWYNYQCGEYEKYPEPVETIEFSKDGVKWITGNFEFQDTDGAWMSKLDGGKSVFVDHYLLQIRPLDWYKYKQNVRQYQINMLVNLHNSFEDTSEFIGYLYDCGVINNNVKI